MIAVPGNSDSASSKTSFDSMSMWLVGSSSSRVLGPGKHQLQKRKPGLFAAAERSDAEENVIAAKQKSAQQRTHLGVSVKAVGLLHFFQHRVGRIQQLLSLIVVAEVTLCPMRRRPLSGASSCRSRRSRVVLPTPLGPTMQTFSPRLMSRSTFSNSRRLLRAGAEGFCQSLGHDHIAAGLKILFKFYLDAALCALRRVQRCTCARRFSRDCARLASFSVLRSFMRRIISSWRASSRCWLL